MELPVKPAQGQLNNRFVGYILRYLIRFIEMPYLFILAISVVFTFLILLGDVAWANRWFSYLLTAPVIGFKAALSPELVGELGTREILISAGFWITIYHLFWELGYAITKQMFFRNSRIRLKSLAWLLVGVNVLFFVGTVITGSLSTNNLFALLIYLVVITILGLGSLKLSAKFRAIADIMIDQNPDTENVFLEEFFKIKRA